MTTDQQKEQIAFWLDIALNLIIIVGLVFVIRSYFISPFQVYGPSMCNTLNFIDNNCQRGYGEYLIVNKFVYQNFFGWQVGLPQRGDVIVFHPPMNNEEFFIKRVIGLPGETVKIIDGKIYIFNETNPDGYELDETYLSESNQGNTKPLLDNIRTFEVPADQYFVLGDNRQQSSDSRSCFIESYNGDKCGENGATPFLTVPHIEGKAALVLWPIQKLSTIKTPDYSLQ